MDAIKTEVYNILESAIHAAVDAGELAISEVPTIPFSPTKTPEHGDIATPIALGLAKQARMAPRTIAEIIVSHINPDAHPVIRQIDIAGAGFINIHLSDNWLYDTLHTIAARQSAYGTCEKGAGKQVQIEFVSANPTGPLNIVSGRAAAVGDTLVNLLNAIGYNAIREFYVNDAGGQVQRLGESIDVRYRQALGEEGLEIPEGGYQGEYLQAFAQTIVETEGNAYLHLETDERVALFRDKGIAHILGQQRTSLERFGVNFDVWSSEKVIRDSGKPEEIIQVFRENGYLYEAEGATWFRMTDFGDDKDCVVIKSDGEYTYFVPDAAYHRDKFDRGFTTVIDLLGPDHQGHITHLKNFVKGLGMPDDWLEIFIIQQVNLVNAEGNRLDMSKRRGQFYTLDTLIDELAETVDEQFAVDVARYFFLMRANSSHLDFNMELAITHASENPVFYIQYAHARCCSIFEQGDEHGIIPKPIEEASLKRLTEPMEHELIRKLAEFPSIVRLSAEAREAHRIPHYLYELSGIFHPYYNQHRVLDPADMKKTYARLILIQSVQTVLKNGLTLLGISAPESM
ncbi:arginine--tRNA ligase [Candidatus Poribacteria bacterium]|nr:arginine--tRNA ligase [Candidatus Poribacteria bacterium]MYK96284.1 arginine--tRNA ligase [Candidatus Poribacteria bacterium]